MSFNSGLTSVTGNVTTVLSAGTPQTILCGQGVGGSNNTVTLATVNAGKTAYLLAYTISASCTSSAGSCTANLKADATTLDIINVGTAASQSGTASKSLALPMGMGYPLAATKTFSLVTSGTSSATNITSATVWYIEV